MPLFQCFTDVVMMSLQEIRDYSLSQTTLDDVFIHFASEGEEPGEKRRGDPSVPLPDVVTHSRGVRTVLYVLCSE